MVNKLILGLVGLLLMPCLLCGQEKVKDPVYYDITDHLPVFGLYEQGEKIMVDYYYTALDPTSSIGINIDFIGGVEQLSNYCDSLYYASASEYEYRETNVRVPYSILFNKELKVQEVHILKRPLPYYNYNDRYDYNSLIKRILFSTDGKWFRKGEECSDWYFRIGHFHLK